MANKESTAKTFIVALALCVVCSVIVSTAAVSLAPQQKVNKQKDIKQNILQAAGMYDPAVKVDEQFAKVQVKIVDLDTGKFSDAISDVTAYDAMKAAKDPKQSEALSKEEDIASISRREKYAKVYLVEGSNGQIEKVILPIRGYGLWSTLKGFIALEADLNTVIGLGYYEHGETPGLGGEVDNPNWKAGWNGKNVYAESGDGDVKLTVIKGTAPTSGAMAKYQVDGLSGATLTSNGVDNMIKFWLGEEGFEPFLQNLKKGEA